MDPLSIAVSVGGLTNICISIVKKLGDVGGKFKNASLVVSSLQSEAKIISVSLSQLQSILLDGADAVSSQALLQPEVLSALDIALTGCSVTLSCLEDEIRSFVAKLAVDDGLGFVDRAEVVWKDDKFKELSQQLRGQYSLLSILLHGLQMKSLSEIRRLLNDNQTTIQQIADHTQLLREIYPQVKVAKSLFESSSEVDSVFGKAVPVSASDKEFEFDDLVINSQAYRRVLNAATRNMCNNHGSRQVVDGDLLDLGLILVDLSEDAEKDISTEEKKPSHSLDLLMLPISAEEASNLDQPLQKSASVSAQSPNDQLSEFQSEDQESYKNAQSLAQAPPTSVEESLLSKISSIPMALASKGHHISHRLEPGRSQELSKVSSQAGDEEASILTPKPTSKTKHLRKETTAPQDNKYDSGAERTQLSTSFPHAFERWETLSAHWEGLTSFWIRRIEENSAEINKDPLVQQLARQVTDLSAAGANLFHAIVEMQRLRASSERKFQRWFFEARGEQERAQELIAGLKKALQARRAWEELGRREKED